MTILYTECELLNKLNSDNIIEKFANKSLEKTYLNIGYVIDMVRLLTSFCVANMLSLQQRRTSDQ